MPQPWMILLFVGAVIALVAIVWRPLWASVRESRFARARKSFHIQRERLEIKFLQLAAAKAKPNSPHWTDCEFDDDVAYVRNRSTGELSAFVAVTLACQDGNDLISGVGDLIGNLQAGTAIFRFDQDHWETDGQAILNLSPAEAIRFYQSDLEMVDQEPAGRR